MLKTIKINLDTVEMMLFVWESVADKEKVADEYFIEMAAKPEFKPLYDEDFNENSFRKVLSAISNRERLNGGTKKEARFWNNNMWILEDLENMRNMINPVKRLNLDYLKEKYKGDTKFDEIEVIFIPGHVDEYYIEDNKLYINFFKIMVNYEDSSIIKIADLNFNEYIESKVDELLK